MDRLLKKFQYDQREVGADTVRETYLNNKDTGEDYKKDMLAVM